MLFVTLCNLRPGQEREGPRRRAAWTPPPGMRILGEYWLPSTHPAVVLVTEANELSDVFGAVFEWNDVFDMTVLPAVTGAEGLDIAKKTLAAHEREGVLAGA